METIKHYGRPQGRGLKLHLGCGDYWFDGFLNIDINVYGGTDMIWDFTKGLPFQDKTVERIEMYEVLEHLNKVEADNLLKEFDRVLIDNGSIRLSVPDMDKLIEDYPNNKEKTIEFMYGFSHIPGQAHKWGYTAESLEKLFDRFRNIQVEHGFLPERPTEPKLILEGSYDRP